MKRSWSKEDISTLRTLYEKGETDEAIAILLGRSIGSVSNCRQTYRIHRPRESLRRPPEWTTNELRIVSKMYAIGYPNNEIAKAVNRTFIAIKRLVTERGFRRFKQKFSDEFDTSNEKWKQIDVVPKYAVSTRGRVLSLHHGRRGQILSSWTDKDGYQHVQLQVNSDKNKRYSIHRLVALTFLGMPPSKNHQVAHNDGNPSNNKLSNLRWATLSENQADRLIHGTSSRRPSKLKS